MSADPFLAIEWCDPPPAGWGHWQKFAHALKERPGEWAKVVSGSTQNYAHSVAHKSLKPLGCEATIRKIDGEGWAVFARWPQTEHPFDYDGETKK